MKQVIVVDASLQLPRGKLAAQVAHAAVAACLASSPEARRLWLEDGMPKIVLRIDTEQGLVAIEEAARRAKLPVALIRDAGRTVLESGTATCVGIGPAEDERIDAVTSALKLL
jgi:peptidyl-tRNA hydrolase